MGSQEEIVTDFYKVDKYQANELGNSAVSKMRKLTIHKDLG